MPRVAHRVLPIGKARSCDHRGADRVLAYRARSGWLTIFEAVFPIVELIPESIAQASALPVRPLEPKVPASWPRPFTMQKMKRPITTGGSTTDLMVKIILTFVTGILSSEASPRQVHCR